MPATTPTSTTSTSLASRVDPHLLIYLSALLFIISIVLFLIGNGILCGTIK